VSKLNPEQNGILVPWRFNSDKFNCSISLSQSNWNLVWQERGLS